MPKRSSKKQITSFQKRVYEVVKRIPRGKVMTYKEVSQKTSRPRAWRAVGNVLNKSASWRTKIPCHRVIKSNGRVGGYKNGTRNKIALLKKEGLKIEKEKVIV